MPDKNFSSYRPDGARRSRSPIAAIATVLVVAVGAGVAAWATYPQWAGLLRGGSSSGSAPNVATGPSVAPRTSAPRASAPDMTALQVDTPMVDVPKIETPSISTANIQVSTAPGPSIGAPSAPSADAAFSADGVRRFDRTPGSAPKIAAPGDATPMVAMIDAMTRLTAREGPADRSPAPPSRRPQRKGESLEVSDLAPFEECDVCPTMIALPAGQYAMGSPGSDEDRRENEGPQTTVSVARFAISRSEITRAEYGRFVDATGRSAPDGCWADIDGKWGPREGRTWRKPGFVQGGDHPVVCVSWEDANAYAEWISEQTGGRYRLPSEAEWEYAARAGSTTRYFFGDGVGLLDYYGWQRGNSDDITHPIGAKAANAWGVGDMHGNVWEWAADCWSDALSGVPGDGAARSGAQGGDCARAPVRGGSYHLGPVSARSASRNGYPRATRWYDVGFRLVRELPN